jgi:restriction endonuclease S subunit
MENMSGSTQSYVTQQTLRDLPILDAPKEIIKDFCDKAKTIVKQLDLTTRENEYLNQMQSLLLSKIGG